MKYWISYISPVESGFLDEQGNVTDIDFAEVYTSEEQAQKEIDRNLEKGYFANGNLSVYSEEQFNAGGFNE